jgi:hypothetical protein
MGEGGGTTSGIVGRDGETLAKLAPDGVRRGSSPAAHARASVR